MKRCWRVWSNPSQRTIKKGPSFWILRHHQHPSRDVLSLMRDWEGKAYIYIDIYRYRYIYRKHRVRARLLGWRSGQPTATANICNNLHFLCRQIELVDFFVFPGKYVTIIMSLSPTPFSCQTTKADHDDCRCPREPRLHTLQDGRAPHLFSSLCCSF